MEHADAEEMDEMDEERDEERDNVHEDDLADIFWTFGDEADGEDSSIRVRRRYIVVRV